MGVDIYDFEFYTFFTGLKQKELTALRELLQSFPYYDSHKVNVIDQSQAVKTYLESGAQKLYTSWRSYLVEPERDLDEAACEKLFSDYANSVNRIVQTERFFHGQGIDRVMKYYSSSPYVIVMDSDIVFTADHYLSDMMSLCDRYGLDELAAVGMLYQKRPFHLTLSREVHPSFHIKFMASRNEQIDWWHILKTAFNHVINKDLKQKPVNYLGRFPQMHPALLMINREIFVRHDMTFHNLCLDVLDIIDGHETKHKILGDNGASFLYQCALAGKQIISIDFGEYIVHRARVAVTDKNAKSWSWFNEDFSNDTLT